MCVSGRAEVICNSRELQPTYGRPSVICVVDKSLVLQSLLGLLNKKGTTRTLVDRGARCIQQFKRQVEWDTEEDI